MIRAFNAAGGVPIRDVKTAFRPTHGWRATILRTADVASAPEVGQLMATDHDGRFVGSLSEGHLARAIFPGRGIRVVVATLTVS